MLNDVLLINFINREQWRELMTFFHLRTIPASASIMLSSSPSTTAPSCSCTAAGRCQFHQHLRVPSSYKSVLHSFYVLTFWLCDFFVQKNISTKVAHKMLLKLTTGWLHRRHLEVQRQNGRLVSTRHLAYSERRACCPASQRFRLFIVIRAVTH